MPRKATFYLFIAIFLFAGKSYSQIMISGTVLDSTKVVPVPSVKVTSTGGNIAYTDSGGQYKILVSDKDSISFFYRKKSTIKYPVSQIKSLNNFDISLQIRLNVNSNYKTLQEVIVIGKSYKEDSLENRMRYSKVFNFQKGGVRVTTGSPTDAMGGVGAGLDPNELINLFRFKRNKSMKRLQNQLIEEEQQKYVDYKFNKHTVKQISGLDGADLEKFMRSYRPSYEFAAYSTEIEFAQYILDASKYFKTGVLPYAGFGIP